MAETNITQKVVMNSKGLEGKESFNYRNTIYKRTQTKSVRGRRIALLQGMYPARGKRKHGKKKGLKEKEKGKAVETEIAMSANWDSAYPLKKKKT